ncbi:hypothetical protein [Rhodovulum adriaticum]|uniref:Uncharacterized protein n=1 Tax=Rhodovulum adriaticum TaxID=35804 RepID=A0A4R2NWY6_RHOAD|nr:hypothetical protein [Rhodovulum adriaticum]MBK1635643.1 hypothetical protein [Rhodovulum adriaticum]TCP26121.1 hypothetical protein EV656_10283 [Rhodovulum adriaticum]
MMRRDSLFGELWQSARRVAFAILGGVIPRFTPEEIEERVSRRAAHEQAAIVIAVLMALLFASLLFANGGVIGLLVYFLLVIYLVR